MGTILRRFVVPLRVLLLLLFGILIVLQTLSLPGQFAHMARESPDLAYLRWPLTAVSVFWVLCAQVVVGCTWKLLTLVTQDRVFSNESFAWVDGILVSLASAWAALVVVGGYTAFRADDPSTPLVIVLLSTVVAIAALLMLVMRSLLQQATALRSEMESVI